MNIFLDGRINTLINQSKGFLGKPVEFLIDDVVSDFTKKYSGSILSYDGKPFQVTRAVFAEGDWDTLVDEKIELLGNMYDSSTFMWKTVSRSICDPKWDFSFYPTKIINTHKGALKVVRIVKKQWKWGLTNNNTKLYYVFNTKPVASTSTGDYVNLLDSGVLEYLFNNKYPNISQILEYPKAFPLRAGVALSEDMVVKTQSKPVRGLYVYYRSHKLPIGRIMRKSGRFVPASDRFNFLKEKLQELKVI